MDKELKSIIQKLEKKHGKGVLMDLDGGALPDVEFQSTGILTLDEMLGGGVPKGRIVEIYGMEACGKTTLCIQIAKSFQDSGEQVAYLDLENAFDPTYAKNLGLDLSNEKMLFSQPDFGEQALDIIDALVKGGIKLVIIDSVASMVPKCELDGNAGDAIVGKTARLMSQAMRRLVGPVAESGATVIFINQIRQKIGVTWGSPNTTTGGLALKFNSSMRIELARIANIKDNDNNVLGINVRAKTVKNKVAPPFQICEFKIMFGKGISRAVDLFETAVEKKIIKTVGARTFFFEDEKIGSSKKEAINNLTENKELLEKIYNKIIEQKNEDNDN